MDERDEVVIIQLNRLRRLLAVAVGVIIAFLLESLATLFTQHLLPSRATLDIRPVEALVDQIPLVARLFELYLD